MRWSVLAGAAVVVTATVLVASSAAKEPRRVRVTLEDKSVVEGTLESVKDGVYSIRIGSTLVTLKEADVKKVEFLDDKTARPEPKAPEKPDPRAPEKPATPEKPVLAPAEVALDPVSGPLGKNIDSGLRWLARHQATDGHWGTTDYTSCCKGTRCDGSGLADFDVGVTGLAVLAFLGAGITPSSTGSYVDPVTEKTVRMGEVVKKGLAYLLERQRSDGSIGPQVSEQMYNDAIATLALAEAYGATHSAKYKEGADAAVSFLQKARNYGLAWRYTPKSGNSDTSVTGWCVRALTAAQQAGLDVEKDAFDGAKAWLDRVTDRSGQVGYDRVGSGEIYVPGKNEAWAHHPTMTAVGLNSWVAFGKKKADLAPMADILLEDLPKWDARAAHPPQDFYYWHHGTLALAALEGPDGPGWKKWSQAVVEALLPHQKAQGDGCKEGSWDTDGVDRWAYAGGRVYGTAIDLLTLEAVNRLRAPAKEPVATAKKASDPLPWNPFAKSAPGDELVTFVRNEPKNLSVAALTYATAKQYPGHYTIEAGKLADTVKVVEVYSTLDRTKANLERQESREFSRTTAPTIGELVEFLLGARELADIQVENDVPVVFRGKTRQACRIRFTCAKTATGFEKGELVIAPGLPAPGLISAEESTEADQAFKKITVELRGFKKAGDDEETGDSYLRLRDIWYERVPADYKKK